VYFSLPAFILGGYMRWWWSICILAIVAGCSTEGKLKIYNNTAHTLYVAVDGESFELSGYTLASEPETRVFTYDTGKAFLFDEGDDVPVDIYLEGETFLMPNDSTHTEVVIRPDKTTKIFTAPTHASIKIENSGDQAVTQVFFRTDQSPVWHVFSNSVIAPDTVWFKQIAFSTEDDVFVYFFRVVMEDGTMIDYPDGGQGVELELDDQYSIVLE